MDKIEFHLEISHILGVKSVGAGFIQNTIATSIHVDFLSWDLRTKSIIAHFYAFLITLAIYYYFCYVRNFHLWFKTLCWLDRIWKIEEIWTDLHPRGGMENISQLKN